jgi:hypothetical protein
VRAGDPTLPLGNESSDDHAESNLKSVDMLLDEVSTCSGILARAEDS